MQWLDIQPGIGIGPVRFGMRPDEVVASFHEPPGDSNWRGGNMNDSLLYLDLRFAFDRCDAQGPTSDGRLNFIVVRPRQDVRLYGRLLNQWTRPDVHQRLRIEGYLPIDDACGDLCVKTPYMGMSFDDSGRMSWLEMACKVNSIEPVAQTRKPSG